MLSGKDMEMSCDEAVMRKMDDDIRAEYAKSLLHFTIGKRKVVGIPLAFGEGDVKGRIKNVMNYKKPAAVAGVIGVLVCLAGGVCLITNPKSEGSGQIPASMRNNGLFGEKDSYLEGKLLSQMKATGKREEEKEIQEENAIRDAIMEHNQSSYPEDTDYACCSFVSLERHYSALANKFTFYGWAYYSEYIFSPDGLEDVGGSHVPVALTFQVDGDEYTLEEYWEPGDGADFAIDVRRKFPAHIVEAGLDSQRFVLQQVQDCYGQAVAYTQTVAYGKMDIDAVIGHLLNVICSELPSESSNPQEYIDVHNEEYRELIYYRDYTVRYCLKCFEQGGENGLKGHIMARVCEEILGIKGKVPVKAKAADNGQAWYDALKDYVGDLLAGFVETEEINFYEEIGIPVSLPQNRSWIQELVVKESDENHLQIQYYDSVLSGQCTLWVVKDGEIDLPDIKYEEGMDETWEGHTIAERRVAVRVQHAKDWVLASWEYKNYKFAILEAVSPQQSDTLSIPKTALGIIAALE